MTVILFSDDGGGGGGKDFIPEEIGHELIIDK